MIDIGDVELLLDREGEIIQLAIRRVNKYIEEDEDLGELVRKIAVIYMDPPKKLGKHRKP